MMAYTKANVERGNFKKQNTLIWKLETLALAQSNHKLGLNREVAFALSQQKVAPVLL